MHICNCRSSANEWCVIERESIINFSFMVSVMDSMKVISIVLSFLENYAGFCAICDSYWHTNDNH